MAPHRGVAMVRGMPTEPKPPPLPERLSGKAAQLAAEAAGRRAVGALESAAHSVLDDVERLVFGSVGGAEAAIRAEEGAGSALERARAAYGLEAQPATPPPAEDPLARAQQQLAELKARRAAPTPGSERKKTL